MSAAIEKSIERRQWDVLLVLTAPPHSTDTLTTVLRLARAVLDRGRTVRFWACGYNTLLTQVSLGETKPVNPRDPDRVYPSAAGTIRTMLTEHSGRMGWLVCTACSVERGARRHIAEVRLRSVTRFAATIRAADHTVYIGGA